MESDKESDSDNADDLGPVPDAALEQPESDLEMMPADTTEVPESDIKPGTTAFPSSCITEL